MATFLTETAQGTGEVGAKAYHLSLGRIWIKGEITEDSATEFMSQLFWLADLSIPATIYIDSTGGDVAAGLTIIDSLMSASIPIDLVCVGKAFSMGAMILACGEKGHRYCLPHAKVMLHQPYTGGVSGTASNIRERSESLLETQNTIVDLLVKHTGHAKKVIEKAISYDHFFKAEDALKYGLIDYIGYPENH